jgi:hypothetical protein
LAPSFLWFAPIQGIERKKDLAGSAPTGSFVPAEAIGRVVGQIGEAQKATREVRGTIDGEIDNFRPGIRQSFSSI